jgi:ABC-type cobalamin/Fe3+-siderophores transport system ATPase subunit
VHALVGENGAGKSSLGKIIGGYYTPDEGEVSVFGERVARFSPREALGRGVAMIHQELQLVPELNVVQNVFLGRESARGGILVKGDLERFAALEKTCDFGIDPLAKVGSLRIAERQKVEIMRAIARDARVIIMDEPTSSLTEDEADRLHEVIRRLKAQGKTIIYVSHFLDHIIANCDNVTVMRDGRVVRTCRSPARPRSRWSIPCWARNPTSCGPNCRRRRTAPSPHRRAARRRDAFGAQRHLADRPPRRDRRPHRPGRLGANRGGARHVRRRPDHCRRIPDRGTSRRAASMSATPCAAAWRWCRRTGASRASS